jgi:hypothetical protein
MKELTADRLEFDRGDETFTKEEFTNAIRPFFKDLYNVGRTNYLFFAQGPDGKRIGVTGYKTETTINATINQKVLEAERAGGKWAVYRLLNT